MTNLVDKTSVYLLNGRWYSYSRKSGVLYNDTGTQVARIIHPPKINTIDFVYSRLIFDKCKTPKTPKMDNSSTDTTICENTGCESEENRSGLTLKKTPKIKKISPKITIKKNR